jgi:hypothetical protein
MSEPTDRRRTFENITLALSLFILLIAATILVLLTVGSTLLDRQQTPDPALEARLEALDVKADEALAAAQTAVAKAEALEAQAGVLGSPSNPTSGSAQAEIAVEGGVALTYKAADQSEGRIFYRVDCLVVYRNFDSFEGGLGKDPCLGDKATIQLALVETGQDSDQYHLLYHERDRPADDPQAKSAAWSEYDLIAEFQPAQAGGEASMTAERLTLYESEPQNINDRTGIVTSTTTIQSLTNFKSALSSSGLDSGLTSRLLLADDSSGETVYTLVVREPSDPAGDDRKKHWCKKICGRRGCKWICK